MDRTFVGLLKTAAELIRMSGDMFSHRGLKQWSANLLAKEPNMQNKRFKKLRAKSIRKCSRHLSLF